MKIAFCTNKDNSDSQLETRFGRATCFAIYNDETEDFSFVENSQNLNAAQGAGIQAAQTIVDSGATVLVACNVGPKAMRVLLANEIKVYQAQAGLPLKKALEKYSQGEFAEINEANVEGHW